MRTWVDYCATSTVQGAVGQGFSPAPHRQLPAVLSHARTLDDELAVFAVMPRLSRQEIDIVA
jgi:hypothetical protein